MLRASWRGTKCIGDRLWLREIGSVENFEAFAIDDEGVAKLYGDAAWTIEHGYANAGGDARSERMSRSTTRELCL